MKPVCRYPYNSNRYFCQCHEKMGNDFYFLPSDECLYVVKRRPVKSSWLEKILSKLKKTLATSGLGQ